MKAQAKAISEKLMKDGKLNSQMTLAEIERSVLSTGQQFQEMLTEAMIEATHQKDACAKPVCPKCGGKMRHQGYRKRQIVTETGEVVLRRAYRRCEACGEGFFPLDRRLGLGESVYSPGLAKQMVWLSALLPYEQAGQVLERVGHHSIPVSSIWRQNQTHGKRMRAYIKWKEGQVKPERVFLPPPGKDHQQVKGVSIDGGMVNIREEGWKEMNLRKYISRSLLRNYGVIKQDSLQDTPQLAAGRFHKSPLCNFKWHSQE